MALNSMKPAAGKLLSFSIVLLDEEGQPSSDEKYLCIKEWDWLHQLDKLDVTSSCSKGKREYIPGLEDVTMTATGVWDLDYNPFVDAPAFPVGTYVQGKAYIDVDNNPTLYAVCNKGLVVKWHVNDKVDQLCEYDFEIAGNFEFSDFGVVG